MDYTKAIDAIRKNATAHMEYSATLTKLADSVEEHGIDSLPDSGRNLLEIIYPDMIKDAGNLAMRGMIFEIFTKVNAPQPLRGGAE